MAVSLRDVTDIRRQVVLDILEERGIDELVAKMLAYPAEIRRHQEAAAVARRAVEEARGELQLQESILMAEIVSATDPKTGKALFSNDPLVERNSKSASPPAPTTRRRQRSWPMPRRRSGRRSLRWSSSNTSFPPSATRWICSVRCSRP